MTLHCNRQIINDLKLKKTVGGAFLPKTVEEQKLEYNLTKGLILEDRIPHIKLSSQ